MSIKSEVMPRATDKAWPAVRRGWYWTQYAHEDSCMPIPTGVFCYMRSPQSLRKGGFLFFVFSKTAVAF